MQEKSLIFKTFDNDISKISAKWGIFNKSFYEIAQARKEYVADMESAMSGMRGTSNVKSFWSRLGWTRKSIEDKLIDVDTFTPKLTQPELDNWVNVLKEIRNGTNEDYADIQELFDKIPEGQKYIAEYAKTNEDGIYSTAGLGKACEDARESVIAQNNALEQTTVSAKAASLGMKALSMAGNMLISMGISMAIQAIISVIDELAHASEHAKERIDDFNQTVKESRDKLKEQSDFLNSDEIKEWEELSKGVDAYGNSIYLSTEEMDKYHSISNKIAEMFPAMRKNWDEQGNSVIKYGTSLSELNEELEKNRKLEYQTNYAKASKTFSDWKTDVGINIFGRGNLNDINTLNSFIQNGFKVGANSGNAVLMKQIAKEMGIQLHYDTSTPGEEWFTIDESEQSKFISEYQRMISVLNSEAAKVRPIIEYYLNVGGSEYTNLSEEAQNQIDRIVNSFDAKFLYSFDSDTDLYEWVETNLVRPLKDDPSLALSLDDFIKLDKESISEGDLNEAWATLEEKLRKAGFSDEIIMQIKLAFDVKDISDERLNQIKEKVASMKGIPVENVTEEMIKEFQKEFSKPAVDLILNPESKIEVAQKTYDDIHKQVEKHFEDQPITLQTQYDDLEDSGFIHGINSIKKAMDELEDKGAVDYTSVYNNSKTQSKQGIMQLLGGVLPHKEMEQYTKDITDMTKSTDGRRKSLVKLSQAYITGLIAQGKFKTADENMLATVLNEAGVMNSLAVAHDMVAQSKIKAALATADFAEMTDEDYQAFLKEANAAGITTEAIETLRQKQLEAQRTMTSETVQSAATRIGIYKSELEAIKTINDAFDLLVSKGQFTPRFDASGALTGVTASDDAKAILNGTVQLEEYNKELEKIQGSLKDINIDFKPSDKKNTVDKTIRDTKKSLEDLAKSEALQKFKYRFDDLERSINKTSDALSILDNVMSMQADDDYIGKLTTTTAQIDLAQQKASLLRNEFGQLSQVQATSGDMAQELANRMKSVADNIATNAKNMRDYGKNMAEYYTSALKSISSTQKVTLDKATSLFERNVKSLSEGGLIGFDFSLSPTVPESAYEKQRKENQTLEEEMRRYYDAIAAMQKTALDMQFQEQMADNERKRQDLNEQLQDAYDKKAQYAGSELNLQKDTNKKVKDEQKQTDAETTNEMVLDTEEKKNIFNRFADEIINTYHGILEELSKAPEADEMGWKKFFDKIKDNVSNFVSLEAANSIGRDLQSSSKGNGVVNEANKYVGKTPYVWGGSSPVDGWDCSAFVQYVFAQNGVKVGRNTTAQWEYGDTSNRVYGLENLQPGDAMYFAKGGKTYHTGIYAGNGEIIHAKGSKYGTVREALSDTYKKNFVGAIRPYAKGTQDFKAYGDNIDSVGGENYNREILINKKTGEQTVIDKPTFFD